MNSWLPSICWPERPVIEREIDTASVNASMVMMSAGKSICEMLRKEKSGKVKGGVLDHRAPTVPICVVSTPTLPLAAAASRLPATSATIM